MAKEKESLQKQLSKRKMKVPNKIINFFYHFLFRTFVMPKYRPHIKVIDKVSDCKGACFLIWNHLSRLDHGYLMSAAYPRPLSIVAGYNEFFRSHLHTVFKLMRIVPKKNFAYDPGGIKAMNSIIRQGGCLAFSPEGTSSITGINQPVVAGTGHFIRHFKIPVYYMELRGQYLTCTKVCLDERYGRTEGELRLLFTPEDLERMTDDEVENKINELFKHDDYEWGKQNHIKWKNNGQMARQLNDMLYKCPKCGAEFTLSCEGNVIRCEKCGNGASINDYYEFVPLDDTCVLPESPSVWVQNQRQDIIREIRADNKYSFTEHVKMGYLPEDHLVKNKQLGEMCGEGDLTFDHDGIHYRGTKLGKPFDFDLTYTAIFQPSIVTDLTNFCLYVNLEFHVFYPEHHTTGKILLITEEMHRLHVNTWKNFPWFDYMYENVPEYIPAAKEEEDQ